MADKPVKTKEDSDNLENVAAPQGNGAPAAPAAPSEERRPPAPRRFTPRGPAPQQRGGYKRYGSSDGDGGRGGPGGNRRGGYFPGRRRVCPIKYEEVDWKNLDSLRYFVSDDGSIRPRRKTGANARLQRKVAIMVKRARHMALLPYTGEHIRISGRSR
jgi:small subunit ribosomal protein S18